MYFLFLLLDCFHIKSIFSQLRSENHDKFQFSAEKKVVKLYFIQVQSHAGDKSRTRNLTEQRWEMFTRCIGKKILENYDDDTVAPHARGIGTSHTQKPSGKSASRNVPYFNDIEK